MEVYPCNSFDTTPIDCNSLYKEDHPSYESSIISVSYVEEGYSMSEGSADEYSMKSSSIYDSYSPQETYSPQGCSPQKRRSMKDNYSPYDSCSLQDNYSPQNNYISRENYSNQQHQYYTTKGEFSSNELSLYNYSPRDELSSFSDTDDIFSLNSRRLYDNSTDSSCIDEDRTTTTTESYTNSRSTPDSIQFSSNGTMTRKSSLTIIQQKEEDLPQQKQQQKPKNGILKHQNNNRVDNYDDCDTTITQRTLDKIRESELEDVLQYARDIVKPDPTAKRTYCKQPAKVINNSFQHLFSVKETFSKTGAFKYQTIYTTRKGDEDIGINLRHGDGWGNKYGIFISRVALGSIFDQYGVLAVGDELVLVNKVKVRKMSVNDVISLMQIPERLSLTVKVLTPFSRKRFDTSDVETLKHVGDKKTNKQKVIAGTHNKGSSYKVAQMKIDNQENQKQQRKQGRGSINKNNEKKSSLSKISPYRTVEGGKTIEQLYKQSLPSTRESTDTEPIKYRKKSIVRWSDQE